MTPPPFTPPPHLPDNLPPPPKPKRMELCAKLWSAGIKAEFGFKPNPKMGDQLGHALESGIPFMVLFGEDELAAGKVKVKDMAAKSEDVVALDALVGDLKARIAALPTGLAAMLHGGNGSSNGGGGGGRGSLAGNSTSSSGGALAVGSSGSAPAAQERQLAAAAAGEAEQ
jgi:hypothetical protein